MQDNDNVILFPGMRNALEQESFTALDNKNYSLALTKLNQLIDHGIDHHDIIMGKLTCLMALGQLDEARDFNELMLDVQNPYYYEYLHIYLNILFQSAQYDTLIERAEDELASEFALPDGFYDQLIQLLELSRHMQDEIIMEQSARLMGELHQARQNENHHKQWRILEKLRHIGAYPRYGIVHYLIDDSVHPMVKTNLFEWYRQQNVDRSVEVHKMGLSAWINPAETLALEDQPIYVVSLSLISDMDQDNPTLSRLLKDLTIRFFHVRYPLLPMVSDAETIAEAIRQIGTSMLDPENRVNESDPVVSHYMAEVRLCDGLYLSIMDT